MGMYWDELLVELKVKLVIAMLWTADVLCLGNMTQEQKQREDQYLVPLVAAKKAMRLDIIKEVRYMVWKNSLMF